MKQKWESSGQNVDLAGGPGTWDLPARVEAAFSLQPLEEWPAATGVGTEAVST